MTIFQRLLRLYPGTIPREDFFTEIVAHLFSIHLDLLLAWLEQLKIVDQPSNSQVRVITQHTIDALDHHEWSSRIDLLVELDDGVHIDWIIIESKLGSTEGPQQLRRYAEHLANNRGIRRGVLLFITRDYEPKDSESILSGLSNQVTFLQLRWHDFYHFLRTQPTSDLINEILGFMQELGMTRSNQFTAADLIALSSLKKVYNLMCATLNEEVTSAFRQATGLTPRHTDVKQLPNRRFFLWAWPSSEWWIGVGFSFASNDTLEYPTIRLQIEVADRAKPASRQQIITAMREIGNRPAWISYDLSAARTWSGVLREQSLRTLLSGDDHVAEMRAVCFKFLEELGQIKQQFPLLPWGNGAVIPSSEEE